MTNVSKIERGLVFDIQRYCVHDGPGIRTVIFFKGCPLRCEWCSNPESLSATSELSYNASDCIGCKTCVKLCKHEALSFGKEGIVIDRQKCIKCFDCVSECPTRALSQKGRLYTVNEIIEIALKDAAFYKKSGGGITLSGGEVLLQSVFAANVLREAKANGVHTATETSGYGSWKDFERVLRYTDLVLFDIKHCNDKIHARHTGIGNNLILENLKRIAKMQIDLIARIPIIPEVNTDKESISSYIRLLRSYEIASANILPFHQLGEAKYKMLGLDYKFKGVRPPSDELMASIKQRMEQNGIKVKIGG